MTYTLCGLSDSFPEDNFRSARFDTQLEFGSETLNRNSNLQLSHAA